MRNLFTCFSNFWSNILGSQSNDVSFDCRLIVGSPSGFNSKWMLKLVSVLVLILTIGSGNAWADYTITFKTSGTTDLIASGGDYATSTETAYVGGTSNGVQFGSGSKGGNILLTMTASGQIMATKITLNGYCKFAKNGGDCKCTIAYTDGSSSETTVTATTTATPTDVSLTSTKTLKSIKLESIGSDKRFYVTGVTVTAAATVAVTGVSLSPTSKSIIVGQTFTVTPTVSPAGATDKVVSWTSSATSKATVTSAGVVSGVAAGSSTITCTTHDGGFTATCSVTVYGITLQAKADDGNGGLDDIGVGGPGAPTFTAATGTITAAANTGNYVFKEWQVTNATAASTTTSPTTISSPEGAVTVTAVYYKPISVSWMVAGSAWNDKGGTATVAYGTAWSSLTLPSDPGSTQLSGCDADKFVGWTPAEISGKLDKDDDAAAISTLESNNLLNSGNKSSKTGKTITTATTFYAVFVDYIE